MAAATRSAATIAGGGNRTLPAAARVLVLLLALLSQSALDAPAQWGPPRSMRGAVDVRIYLEGERELLRGDEPTRVVVETSEDAHVAVVRIDTEGRLDFLFPQTPWGDDYVEERRPLVIPASPYGRGLPQRPGVGYLYAIASATPLDYREFGRDRRSWDWSEAGRFVRGDPFWALEEITRALLPERGYTGHGADFYTYYVGRRYPYPDYACGRAGGGYRDGWDGWGDRDEWEDCGRLEGFLRTHPDYFDTRRYRGDRRESLDQWRRSSTRSRPRSQEDDEPQDDPPRRPVRRRPRGGG